MQHKLVNKALERHHIPQTVSELIRDYYTNFPVRVLSKTFSEWHTLEKGIITGCTMSAVLFSLAMKMLVKAAKVECRGPLSKSGVCQPLIRAYMDDLITTTSVTRVRWILKGLENIKWARMKFKTSKIQVPEAKFRRKFDLKSRES